MKIAVLSDIHEGLNRKRTQTDIMVLLETWMSTHQPDVFIISGDLTAKPDKSLKLLQQLQGNLPDVKILFVHGNHDIYHDDSEHAYETLLEFEGNLGNGPVELGNDWVVIGDGGWYDYSFGIEGYSHEAFNCGTYGDITWPDKTYAHWRGSDITETNRQIYRIERWLRAYQRKNILMVTHVVPFSKYVVRKDDHNWDFFNAMMGSSRFGELAQKYKVKKYIFGHIHYRYHDHYQGIEVICNPLGYFPSEWKFETAEEEIHSSIKVIEI
ncbi:metallophosphoesterase [Thalassobacillus devorans]|uniref:metallophosphoesterase n=1 Tax=Thalassobacillus devorans TaxID=279813 RepID=UPI00048E6CCE|nr:metallophosphoesterase [Thalassobacillus devorans]